MMKKRAIFLTLALAAVGVVFAEEGNYPNVIFPKPHYDRRENDPTWIQKAAEFHGHLGPAVVIGARLGAAGVAAVESEGYFGLQVVCAGPFIEPPQSCMVDGVQLSTGATLGKRNLTVLESPEYFVKVVNRKIGKSVVLRPKPELLQLAWSQLEEDHRDDHGNNLGDHDSATERKSTPVASMKKVEALARQIAALPDDQIMTVERADP